MTRFVLATANEDKAREIRDILGPAVTLLPRPTWVSDVAETGDTLLDNARLKARALVLATGDAAIADDTGLEVDALGGAPGVYSSRYAGEGASYADNVAKLVQAQARVISLFLKNGQSEVMRTHAAPKHAGQPAEKHQHDKHH